MRGFKNPVRREYLRTLALGILLGMLLTAALAVTVYLILLRTGFYP
jgi:hypothetical protein